MLVAKFTQPQRVYLDLVRATAAVAVLVGHAANIFLKESGVANSGIEIFGVLVFFILSGFLISFSVFQRTGQSQYGFTEFFIDRFCRIYCAFLPALAFVWLVDAWSAEFPTYAWQDRFNIPTAIGNVFMMQDFPLFQIARRLGAQDNVWFIRTFGSAGPFWTISIEWWIYMVFGAIALVRIRTKKPFSPWQLLLVLFATIEPAYHFVAGPDHCLTMLWVIGMGVSFAFYKRPHWFTAAFWGVTATKWRKSCFTVFCLSIIALLVHRYAESIRQAGSVAELQTGILLASALFSLFFLCGERLNVPKVIDNLIGFVAGYSYSLYLVHFTVLTFIRTAFPSQHGLPVFWLAIAASNVGAILLWYFFERHYRSVAIMLKSRLAPKRPYLEAA